MARSTFGVFLMHDSSSTATPAWEKLVDIKSFPDLGGDPENIEITTTSDYMRRFIGGLENTQAMTFTANYDKTDYTALEALEGSNGSYSIWMGYSGTKTNYTPDGHDGKFDFSAELYVYVNGGGIGEAVNMTVTLMPTSVISFT